MERIQDLYQFMKFNGDINLPSIDREPDETGVNSGREIELPRLAEIWDINSNAAVDNIMWGSGGEDKGINEI